ncbi:SoxR reducing system RseC family protein [Halanaerobacter jeridensis]|uniref:Sigma-E factor negative regulatory protein RseC n=1 Tax=Halanaerobacter jeridensis TaxID=706427 RepID=A0A938XW39_9FIRM|nr:SoxR reducing system RseC family protein [Halanaerobacter jeridensis]MBM7557351.1 sigma-E factor negative regulatory protein RseC [Halanaerobacter jeridensis]
MKQYARVISKPDSEQVKVMVQKHSACGKCGKCSSDDNLVLTLDNTLNVDIGDVVTIEMKGSSILGAAVLVYFLPLLALIVGYIGAGYLGMQTEVTRIALGGLLFALSFLIARKVGEEKEKDYRAEMQEVVN